MFPCTPWCSMASSRSAIAPSVDSLSRIDRERDIHHIAQRERRGRPEGAALRNVGRDPGAEAPAIDRDIPRSATAVDVAMVAAVAEAAGSEAAILIGSCGDLVLLVRVTSSWVTSFRVERHRRDHALHGSKNGGQGRD